jgi:hypothetical protein
MRVAGHGRHAHAQAGGHLVFGSRSLAGEEDWTLEILMVPGVQRGRCGLVIAAGTEVGDGGRGGGQRRRTGCGEEKPIRTRGLSAKLRIRIFTKYTLFRIVINNRDPK